MLLCMVCLSTLSIQRSKHANALNAMFVETVNTLVFVTLTQHLIQSTMGCENSTLLCIQWPKLYVDTLNTKHIHTFLCITFLIFN